MSIEHGKVHAVIRRYLTQEFSKHISRLSHFTLQKKRLTIGGVSVHMILKTSLASALSWIHILSFCVRKVSGKWGKAPSLLSIAKVFWTGRQNVLPGIQPGLLWLGSSYSCWASHYYEYTCSWFVNFLEIYLEIYVEIYIATSSSNLLFLCDKN